MYNILTFWQLFTSIYCISKTIDNYVTVDIHTYKDIIDCGYHVHSSVRLGISTLKRRADITHKRQLSDQKKKKIMRGCPQLVDSPYIIFIRNSNIKLQAKRYRLPFLSNALVYFG